MKQEYYIKFNTNADSKGLDDLSRKSVSAKSNFEGLRNTIGGVGSQVANLTAGILGLGATWSAISFAQKGIEEAHNAKGNIIDFQRHSYGKQHAMELVYMAEKLSKDYKLSRTNTEQAFYKAVQNRKIFDNKEDLVNFMKLSADYTKASGQEDMLEVTTKLLKIKKMGNVNTEKMRALLDQITYYEDDDGMTKEELISGLVSNLDFISDNTDLEEFLNLYNELVAKSGDQSRANKTFQSFLIKRSAIKKSKDNSDNAMAKLIDKKTKEMGVGIEEWKKMDDAKAFRLLLSSLNFDNEAEMELFSEAIGEKEALKLQNKNIADLDRNSYKDNLLGEVEKAIDKEGFWKATSNFFTKTGGDIVRNATGQDAYGIFKESQKAEIQRMREQGYQSFEIDSVLRKKFNEETARYDQNQVNSNNVITNTNTININGAQSPKDVGIEVNETLKKISSGIEQKLNKQ